MGTVVQFEKQSSEATIGSHHASASVLYGTPGIDVERLGEVISQCELAVARVVKLRSSVDKLENLELVLIDPSSREAMERVIRFARLELPSQLVTLAQSLIVLRGVAERASKLLDAPQSFVVERRDFAEV